MTTRPRRGCSTLTAAFTGAQLSFMDAGLQSMAELVATRTSEAREPSWRSQTPAWLACTCVHRRLPDGQIRQEFPDVEEQLKNFALDQATGGAYWPDLSVVWECFRQRHPALGETPARRLFWTGNWLPDCTAALQARGTVHLVLQGPKVVCACVSCTEWLTAKSFHRQVLGFFGRAAARRANVRWR